LSGKGLEIPLTSAGPGRSARTLTRRRSAPCNRLWFQRLNIAMAWPDGCWRPVCGHRHFVREPTTLPWGNRSLLLRDPDGDLVNFFTPLTPAAIGKFAR
jgi:hypothetical protein